MRGRTSQNARGSFRRFMILPGKHLVLSSEMFPYLTALYIYILRRVKDCTPSLVEGAVREFWSFRYTEWV